MPPLAFEPVTPCSNHQPTRRFIITTELDLQSSRTIMSPERIELATSCLLVSTTLHFTN